MANRTWDDDEEASEWAKMRRASLKAGRWKTISVELENKRGYVSLERGEWLILQSFVENHKLSEITCADYKDLPPKVRFIVHDWCMT